MSILLPKVHEGIIFEPIIFNQTDFDNNCFYLLIITCPTFSVFIILVVIRMGRFCYHFIS